MATRRHLNAFLAGASRVALLTGGAARTRSALATHAIETAERWLRVSMPSRAHAHLALDLHADGAVLFDGVDGTDVGDIVTRVLTDARDGCRRHVILSGAFDDLACELPVTRIVVPGAVAHVRRTATTRASRAPQKRR